MSLLGRTGIVGGGEWDPSKVPGLILWEENPSGITGTFPTDALAQPNSIFVVGKFTSFDGDMVTGPNPPNIHKIRRYNGSLVMDTGSKQIDTGWYPSSGVSYVFSGIFNGASSFIRAGGAQRGSGDMGADGMDDVIVASLNAVAYGLLVYHGRVSDEDILLLEEYLNALKQ